VTIFPKQCTVVILVSDGDTDLSTAWSASDNGDSGCFAGPLRAIAAAAAESHVEVEVFPGELWTADDVSAAGALAAIVSAAGKNVWFLDRGPGPLVARLLGVTDTVSEAI
jgi:hypothetical protein